MGDVMFAVMKRAIPVALGLLLLAWANGSRIKPVAGSRAGIPQAASADASPFHLDVAITDEDGNVAGPGLTRGNFRLSDNGRDLPITGFAPASAPATVALLVENSGMAYNYFAYKAAAWGDDFLSHLAPDDYVALVTYDLRPSVRVDFTRNKAQVREALRTLPLPPFREANLFDALVETLDRLDRVRGKKAIVLITTGFNTFSASNFDNVRQRLRETDTTVFVVGTAEAEYMAAESSALSSGGRVGYLQVKNQLGAMAKMSGGKAWFPRFSGELPDVFEATAAMLRNQYRLGFSPAESLLDGKYHKLKVSVVGPDGSALKVTDSKGKRRNAVVHAREGYMARRAAPDR
jgi:VWFA-related protein